MKILITGGSGVLGSKLLEYCKNKNYDVIAPKFLNIIDINLVQEYITLNNPDIIIHTAAYVDTLGCEKNFEKALVVNVEGTINLVRCCPENCKFVYISSEYVFSGNKGNYSPEDRLDPINVYGKTKAAAEYIVSILSNYQIIRVPFIKKIYPEAFDNQICSRYFVEETPEKIIENALHNPNRIIHISTNEPKSLYDHYVDKNIKVEPIPIPEEYKEIIPRNTSLKNTSPF